MYGQLPVLIIGNGMLAKAFEAYGGERPGLILFCSGVSNSKETSAELFCREKSLLLETMFRNPESKIVYFSSCASGHINTPYYQHKKNMESLVESSGQNYLVIRLPQVVGVTNNSTLVSFIAKNVKSGKPLTVYQGAKRNLIDVEDVVRLTLFLADFDNLSINVTNSHMASVEEIVSLISGILGDEPIILAGPSDEQTLEYDGGPLKELIGSGDPIYSADYNQAVLSKYVPLLCN